MSGGLLRDLIEEIAEMIQWWPREEPNPDLSCANDYQIQDAGIDWARYEIARSLRPYLGRFEAARAAQASTYDLRLRVHRGEFEPQGPLTIQEHIRETARLRHAFAEAIRTAYGDSAVAHEHIYLEAERLAADRRLRIVGRTWVAPDRPAEEQPERVHLLRWYDILNSAACAALGLTEWPYPTYPQPPETNASDGHDPRPHQTEPR